MEEIKPWYLSKGVWGGIIAVSAAIVSAFGFDVSPEQQDQIAQLIVSLAGALGGLYAIAGRVKATKRIK